MPTELERLRDVTAELRLRCPWDAQQTHASLLTHLVEETCEVVDAVEAGDDDELCEAVPVDFSNEPITADAVGRETPELVARAQASGIDADAAIRAALRNLEAEIENANAEVRRDADGGRTRSGPPGWIGWWC